MQIILDKHGATWIAHVGDQCDCPADTTGQAHGVADHPTAALRRLLAQNPDLLGGS